MSTTFIFSSCSEQNAQATENTIITESKPSITEILTETNVVANTLSEEKISESDYDIINNIGIIELIDNCNVWKHYIHGSYSDPTDKINTITQINNETYRELHITYCNDGFISRLENALDMDLTETNGYIACPYSSIDELKTSALRCFSEDYINNDTGFSSIVENNSSLFYLDYDYSSAIGIVDEIVIENMTEDNITFLAYFIVPDNDIQFTYKYTFVYENDHWVLNAEETVEQIKNICKTLDKSEKTVYNINDNK